MNNSAFHMSCNRFGLVRLVQTLVLVGFTICHVCKATMVDPFLWEELVRDADFVGIVECETAGGIVATYRVVESWKGAEAGSRFNIAVAVNFWEPQFPIALCGEQYLVTAFKRSPGSRILSTTGGGPVPLWWRKIPADYRLPLFQGCVALPLAGSHRPLHAVGSEHLDLETFREAVADFLSRPEEQEIRIWQQLAEKYFSTNWTATTPEMAVEFETFKEDMVDWTSPTQFIDRILAIAPTNAAAGHSFPGWKILDRACSVSRSIAALKAHSDVARIPDYILRSMERRFETERKPEQSIEQEPEVPSESELSVWRQDLMLGQTNRGFHVAFEKLARHDPSAVVQYLLNWTNATTEWRYMNAPYELGSFFARHCPANREAHLETLLNAREPMVRVAAAVYLCFENNELGLASLEEFTSLVGDAGGWAALNLARRGNKSAMHRALELLATPGENHMSGVPHRNLQKRLLVLLSNTAKASGLPPPDPPPLQHYSPKSYQQAYAFWVQWWLENRDNAVIHDPWLELLVAQQVD